MLVIHMAGIGVKFTHITAFEVRLCFYFRVVNGKKYAIDQSWCGE